MRPARLILLNGPPGAGKSTLARRYADEHPLTLALDIDVVRDMLGRWKESAEEAGLLARSMALAAARSHLAGGHDVVIPQYLGRLTFVAQLEQLASSVGAAFHEIVLMDSKENALRRFARRGPIDGRPVSEEEFSRMYDRLLAVVAARPGTKLVPTSDGEVDRAYRDLLSVLGS